MMRHLFDDLRPCCARAKKLDMRGIIRTDVLRFEQTAARR
jgi:hypothetical protein